MAVTIRIPTQLRELSGGASEVEHRGRDGQGGARRRSTPRTPGFAERLHDDSGELRRFVNVFVADEDIRFLDGVDTPVTDGQTSSASSPPSPAADARTIRRAAARRRRACRSSR